MNQLTLSALDVHQTARVLVENNTGLPIGTLRCVTLNGSGLNFPQVIVANPSTAPVFGLTIQPIRNGESGIVHVLGLLLNVDTHLWASNTVLYSDATGHLQNSPSTYGDAPVAIVIKQDALRGSLYVITLASQFHGAYGFLVYRGTWDASGGVYPSSPAKGDYYIISIAGTISGHAYAIGDWITYDGVKWDYVDNSSYIISLNPVGTSPNSYGASVSGSFLTLQPADRYNPGVLTTTTQGISGDKDFFGNVTFDGNLIINRSLTFTPSIDSSLSGTNAGIAYHSQDYTIFTNSSLVSIAYISNSVIAAGHRLNLVNETGNPITIVNNYGSPPPGFAPIITSFGADIVLPNYGNVQLIYDTTSTPVWNVQAGTYTTQLANPQMISGILPITKGGTNSNTALVNNRVMQSSTGGIIEASAIVPSKALISDANGIPTNSTTTALELSYVAGATSNLQTQINAKQGTISGLSPLQAVVTDSSGNLISMPYSYVNTGSALARRDVNGNCAFNSVICTTISTVTANQTIAMNVGSAQAQTVTGTAAISFNLPDATYLINGWPFTFNNNSTVFPINIYLHDGSTLSTSVPPGGYITLICVDNSTANGVWDFHTSLTQGAVSATAGTSFPGTLTANSLSVISISLNGSDLATELSYTPSNPTYWAGLAPTTPQQALDRIASLLYTLNSSVPIP